MYGSLLFRYPAAMSELQQDWACFCDEVNILRQIFRV